jgi:outer membrane protein assembly factor BamB
MLVHNGYLYAVQDDGIVFCWNAETGHEAWKKRLTGDVSASPILAGDHIYVVNERGKLFVFQANPQKFQLVAENQLGDEAFATPAICGGQIFIRVADHSTGTRQERLYCIGIDDAE